LDVCIFADDHPALVGSGYVERMRMERLVCGVPRNGVPEMNEPEPPRPHVQCAHIECGESAMIRQKVGNGWAKLCERHYLAHHAKVADRKAESLGLQKFEDESSREYQSRCMDYIKSVMPTIGAWRWSADKVVNATQVAHIVESAERNHGPAIRLLEQCKAAGIITKENRMRGITP